MTATTDNPSMTLEEVNRQLKSISDQEGISYAMLEKVYYFAKDVKKSLIEDPTIPLATLALKNNISSNFGAVFLDNGYIDSGIAGKPSSHKEWTGGEVTPEMASKLYRLKASLIKELSEKRNKRRSTKSDKTKLSIQDSAKYGALSDEVKREVDAITEEDDLKTKLAYLFMLGVKDSIESDPKASLTLVAQKYKIHASHLTKMSSLGHIINHDLKARPTWEWIGKTPTIKDAKELLDVTKKHIRAKQKKNKERRLLQLKKADAKKEAVKVKDTVIATKPEPKPEVRHSKEDAEWINRFAELSQESKEGKERQKNNTVVFSDGMIDMMEHQKRLDKAVIEALRVANKEKKVEDTKVQPIAVSQEAVQLKKDSPRKNRVLTKETEKIYTLLGFLRFRVRTIVKTSKA